MIFSFNYRYLRLLPGKYLKSNNNRFKAKLTNKVVLKEFLFRYKRFVGDNTCDLRL